ncbi:MAG TPA: tRNA 2-thiouridine(34) synthase MnmA, partial [Candidatus Hydrogenedentes bacterium]|nr:tRNA 2-thiouridine(34) synthase MnmA [Candidatus Hydrogenedentota bacterium]
AQRAADILQIPHYVLNFSDEIQGLVIENFISEYLQGRTPNPCVRCNVHIKFGVLRAWASDMGATHLATGHYARTGRRGDRWTLRRAVDRAKDQSYALAGLGQEALAAALFPLSEMTKEAVRARAHTMGLEAAEGRESQDICFIPHGDYDAFLVERLGTPEPGPIVSARGEILGRHRGLLFYTIGQRKGLGIGGGRAYYVVRLDAEHNVLIVGHEEETNCPGLIARDVRWCSMGPQDAPFACRVQIRYQHEAVPAMATPCGNDILVRFDEPERAVTPGQWAVLYDDDGYVLAAGVMDDELPKERKQEESK